MNKLLSKSWIVAPIGVVLYLAATVLFWEKPKPPAPVKESFMERFSGPSWEFSNPEADQLVEELKSEKKSLDARQQQLDELATRLQSERVELAAVSQSVRQLQSNFDQSVIRVKGDEAVNLKKLAKIYSTMPPESAAKVLSEMDNQAIVKIFSFLKEDEVGSILDALSKQSSDQAKRAAQLSDMIRLLSHDTKTK